MSLMLPANPFVPVLICLLTLHDNFSFVTAVNFTQPAATWLIRERSTDLVCILIRFSAFFSIRYQTANSSHNALLLLPPDASLTTESGYGHSCVTDDEGFLSFDLSFGRESDGLHNLVTHFRKTQDQYQLLGFQLQYAVNPNQFPGHWQPNGTLMTATYFSDAFLVPRGMSYSCKAILELKMSAMDEVLFFVRDLQFEAFTFQPKPVFSRSVECDLDHKFYTDYAALIVFLGVAVIAIFCFFSTFVVIQRSTKSPAVTASTSIASLSSSSDFKH